MLNPLAKSKRFQEDISKYSAAIQNIENESVKIEIKRLVNELMIKVKKMDDLHSEIIYTRQLPSMGKDFRDDIIGLRKKIETKIRENTKRI